MLIPLKVKSMLALRLDLHHLAIGPILRAAMDQERRVSVCDPHTVATIVTLQASEACPPAPSQWRGSSGHCPYCWQTGGVYERSN